MLISHKALFAKMQDTEVVRRSIQYAHWTLPALMADMQYRNGKTVLERDYQEIGALLTNFLSAKLAGILFPSSRPFFKIAPSKELIQQAANAGTPKDKLVAGLSRMEQDACLLLFQNASYNQLILALKQLIVTGNALTYRDTVNHRTVTYGLRSYVTRRDGQGVVLDCILREFTYVEALPLELQEVLKRSNRAKYSRPECEVEVYTRIKRTIVANNRVNYIVTQEVDTTPVGTLGTYPEHLCPWQCLTWNLIPGEHYGRGMVEDYAGGFAKLSDLSEAHALYAIEMMRVIHLVAPSSGTDIDDIAQAETGEYIAGTPDTVKAHESGDGIKLTQVAAEIQQITMRLSKAFMYGSNTRDAERVTAYEIAQDAREAENTLGGNYSSLAESWQIPASHVLLHESKPDVLEGIINEDLKLGIIAGIPALGRASDVQNLLSAAQECAAIVPVLVQVDNRFDGKKVVDMIMAGQSVDTTVLFKDDEQMAKEAEAAAQMQQGQQQVLGAQEAAAQGQQLQELQQGL
jgi:hypothetical protein